MTFGDGVKAAALLFVAAIAQVSIFSQQIGRAHV